MAATRDLGSALLYLCAVGLGTTLDMMDLTGAMAAPLALAGQAVPNFARNVRWVSGAASVVFGLFLLYQIGPVEGLFGVVAQVPAR